MEEEEDILIAPMIAEPIAPTVEKTDAELEAAIWDKLVQEGRSARETHDDTNWRVGRAAVIASQTFGLTPDGTPDEHQKKFILKKFAIEIGMVDNPHYIYDLHDTAAFWPEDAETHFRGSTWSAFRTCARHCKSLKQASTIMHQHGESPVAEIRRIIAASNGEPPKKQRRSFDAKAWPGNGKCITLEVLDYVAMWDAIHNNPKATIRMIVEWTDKVQS